MTFFGALTVFYCVAALLLTFIVLQSYHADWCFFQPNCAHTRDICKGADLGPSLTHLLNQILLADPENCTRGTKMTLARHSAYICSWVPFRSFVMGLIW
jgi:hypothetical protein